MNQPNTTNAAVIRWVEEMAALCQPDKIVWCDGSAEEKKRLTEDALAQGVLIKLNQEKCTQCHGDSLIPIWGTPPLFAASYGGNGPKEQVGFSPAELANFKAF